MQEPGSKLERYRQFPGKIQGIAIKALLIAIALACLAYIIDVPTYFRIAFFREQFFGLIYGLVFAAAVIMFPATKKAPRNRVPWYDMILAALGLIGGCYVLIAWPQIVTSLGVLTSDKVILGGITILVILEVTRRIYGWPLVVLAGLFILYARFTWLIPGMLGGSGSPWQRLASFLYLDTGSILGFIAMVVFGMVFSFILFGRTLFATGGGKFFTDISLALMGKKRGGPAKVAVVASSLFGTLSGSASSNVVLTGSITIPMMKNTGYKPAVAAAIESVASSGGVLMPPVMGATAFIIAELLAIPYREVVIAAVIPAVLYYLSLFIQVDLEAVKGGLKGLPAEQLPSLKRILPSGWIFIVPVLVLIYCLFILYLSPAKSALYSFISLIVFSMFRRDTRLTLRRLLVCLEDTGRFMIEIGVISAIAGIIIGIVGLTSLGILFSHILIAVSGGNTYLLLLLTAVASIILGMGMPVTASYIILAVLAAPALVQTGLEPLAAHLFIFYFAMLSFITPPVCVAVYIASPIAGS
ncbi:TRAP transporter permease, partial [Chloroflexota bacterium]